MTSTVAAVGETWSPLASASSQKWPFAATEGSRDQGAFCFPARMLDDMAAGSMHHMAHGAGWVLAKADRPRVSVQAGRRICIGAPMDRLRRSTDATAPGSRNARQLEEGWLSFALKPLTKKQTVLIQEIEHG